MLYSNFILIIKNKDLLQKNQSFKNSTKIVPEKNNIYSDLSKSNLKLYNSMEHPYFSIILLYHKDFRINDHKLTNLIVNLLSQTFIDIQIIIFYDSTFVNIKALISNLSFFNKSLLVYPLYNMHWVNKLNYIINVINGKYLIVLDDFLKLQRDELFNAYNITKGKIDNIFNYSITYNSSFYIIRTKILRDIFDLGINLNNFDKIINYISIYPFPRLNYIHISFCSNDLYTTLTYTSMLSILISKAYYTYIQFYIVIPKDFKKDNILLLESLYQQFEYFNITFIKMDNRFNKAFTSGYLTSHAYYRYSLGELIPNLDKILFVLKI